MLGRGDTEAAVSSLAAAFLPARKEVAHPLGGLVGAVEGGKDRVVGLVPEVHVGVVAQEGVEPRASASSALEHHDAPPGALASPPAHEALPGLVDRRPVLLPLPRRRGGDPSVAQGIGGLVRAYHPIVAEEFESSRNGLVVRCCRRLGWL